MKIYKVKIGLSLEVLTTTIIVQAPSIARAIEQANAYRKKMEMSEQEIVSVEFLGELE